MNYAVFTTAIVMTAFCNQAFEQLTQIPVAAAGSLGAGTTMVLTASGTDSKEGGTVIAEDSAKNYLFGFSGNQGIGFQPWNLSTAGGGGFITDEKPQLFDLWNTTASGQSTATRMLANPMVTGETLTVKLLMTSLDNANDVNLFELVNSKGDVAFAYWHQCGDGQDGHYLDAGGTHGAPGFAYDYNKADTFTFTLTSGGKYTFSDVSTGSSVRGTLSWSSISGMIFVRKNGSQTPRYGQDFKFGDITITKPSPTVALGR